MSTFMKDISVITGHLANVMVFPPHELRPTSSQEDHPDKSTTTSKDHHSIVNETPSVASDSATSPEPRTEPKACHPANREGIALKAYNPASSQPAPFTFGTKKPIVPETPLAACKFVGNHEELNHESKASDPKSPQSASSASAPNETTASQSTCPEDLIATLNAPTPKIQLQTPRPDLMVWTVYKDARYMITYQGQETKSIWLDMEFDGIRTCMTAYELESALCGQYASGNELYG
ncbi:hypothetical protein PSTG_03275 [Puccinia striiformis f. sp. tritici PST-78]|uniref:Uncharacterized protein n=1 Tax=Puccinia striiformis f. sp. tritici PST-78 TaxID=1165861 RepID=A0A0L0VWR1_9BASI|nr:hypothetical protein PSTG_03275 [Puccinia striiformis f. sp. tritici PST-78]